MVINTAGKNLEITPALREYIDAKIGGLDKFLAQFSPENIKAEVIISRITQHHRHGDVFKTSIDFMLPGKTMHAGAEGPDARMTIDDARKKLEREIIKYKDLHARS